MALVALMMLLTLALHSPEPAPGRGSLAGWTPHRALSPDEAPQPAAAAGPRPQAGIHYWWLTPQYELRRSTGDLPDDAGAVWISRGWPAAP